MTHFSLLPLMLSIHEGTKLALSSLCLVISSVNYPVSQLERFTFRKTLEYTSARFFCQFITRITFSPLFSNMFLISFWDPTRIAFATHIFINVLCTFAWKIPWEEPGRLKSMGSLRVKHNWAASLWLFTFMHWRRKWQPTPVFLPGESQGRGSLVGCCLWGRTELDTTGST